MTSVENLICAQNMGFISIPALAPYVKYCGGVTSVSAPSIPPSIPPATPPSSSPAYGDGRSNTYTDGRGNRYVEGR